MAWTQTDLDALDAALATGATEVKHADKTVKYRSLDEMRALRNMIASSLQSPRQRRSTLADFERDL